jgi:hypothetical protein
MKTNIIVQDKKKNIAEFSVIQRKIYEIRGYKVILDRDLAQMYDVTTFNLNKAVKRNIDRFPDDFMFQLNKDEFNLIFQNGISSWGGTRKFPYAFTEHGIAMLAGLLNSTKAIDTNIQIVRTFVALRQYALGYAELNQKFDMYINKTDRKTDDILEVLEELITKKEEPRNQIGFKQKTKE